MTLGSLNHVGIATPAIPGAVARDRDWFGAPLIGCAL